MSEVKECKTCHEQISGDKAKFNQTRYCAVCAKISKRESSQDARSPAEKAAYMKKYMSEYRKRHPELRAVNAKYVKKYRRKKRAEKLAADRAKASGPTFYSFFWILGLLTVNDISQEPHTTLQSWYGVFETAVFYLELVVFRLSTLLVFIWFCYAHLKKHLCKPSAQNDKGQNDHKSRENQDSLELASREELP